MALLKRTFPLLLSHVLLLLLLANVARPAQVDGVLANDTAAADPPRTYVSAGLAGQVPVSTSVLKTHPDSNTTTPATDATAPPPPAADNTTSTTLAPAPDSSVNSTSTPADANTTSAALPEHHATEANSTSEDNSTSGSNSTEHDPANKLTPLPIEAGTVNGTDAAKGNSSAAESPAPANATVPLPPLDSHEGSANSTESASTSQMPPDAAKEIKPEDKKEAHPDATESKPAPKDERSGFPTYAEFAGAQKDSTVKPYLAETDTLYSTDSQRGYGPAPYEVRYRPVGDLDGKFDVPKHWAVSAPYFSSPIHPDVQRFRGLPGQCGVKQVHILQRHGARLPKSEPLESATLFGQWFANVTGDDPHRNGGKKTTFDGPLSFLSTWQYALGTNGLTGAGFQQMFDSGVHAQYRYGGLHEKAKKPVIRVGSMQRMVDSAKFWALGFYGADYAKLVDTEVQIDEQGFNSTLNVQESCPGAKMNFSGTKMKQEWIEKYLARAVTRLQHHVHGATLTPQVLYGMQSMCPYETYALGLSEFCDLFSRQEWEGFEYAHDLEFQGNHGFMSTTGRAQGIGWVQELVARLKGGKLDTPLTSQNTTLDGASSSFPVDQTLYADFTHGRQILAVLTAMNFTTFATQLDTTQPDPARNFVLSHIAPSAARLYLEVLQCDERKEANSGDAQRHYIRAILNDALLPMGVDQGCIGHNGRRDGLCPLESFINHVEKVAVPEANYQEVCFGQNAFANGNSTAASTNSTSQAATHP